MASFTAAKLPEWCRQTTRMVPPNYPFTAAKLPEWRRQTKHLPCSISNANDCTKNFLKDIWKYWENVLILQPEVIT